MAGNEGMRKLINIVNRLQDAFSYSGLPFGLQLPQIAVIGSQSAGKSSVLENFVGSDFLPRGSDIVTRRPLVLQLTFAEEEYSEFNHLPGRRFDSFDDVRREIETETIKGTNGHKGVSSKPIHLKIYSPHVLNLTLVDLPGMTRVAVSDQPSDIDRQISSMVKAFIRQENTLILAVSPANSDLANSDAMRMAREVDPQGNRTIGVITKIDLMDEGTNARPVLMGEVLPLKRGYVGVVNRSQQDIIDRKTIDEAIMAEREFFRSHPAYKDIADSQGTPHLQQVLNRELSRHIKETLPVIRRDLRSRLLDVTRERDELPDISTSDSMRSTMVDYITKFFQQVTTDVEGSNAYVDENKLQGGAKINRMYYNECHRELTVYKFVTDEQLAIIIQNVHGLRNGLFCPSEAIDKVVRIILTKYKEPVKKCVALIADEVRDIVDRACEVIRHNKLREEVNFQVGRHIQEAESQTKTQLTTYVEAELAFMNTKHPDFHWTYQVEVEEPTRDRRESGASAGRQVPPSRQTKQEPVYVMQGYMRLHIKKLMGHSVDPDAKWFTLTTEELSCYSDSKENGLLFKIQMMHKNKLKSSGLKFAFFRTDGQPIIKDQKRVEFSCINEQEMEKWTNAFTLCIDFPEMVEFDAAAEREFAEESMSDSSPPLTATGHLKTGRERKRDKEPPMDSKTIMNGLEKDVAMIKPNIRAYVQIIAKHIQDVVPKYITLSLIESTKTYCTTKLLEKIMSENDIEDLMHDDSGEMNKREELDRAKNAAEEALLIINDADVSV